MADIDDPDALGRPGENEAVQVLDLARAERSRRLVEKQDPWLREQRLDDFEHLALSERERAHRRPWAQVGVERVQPIRGPLLHRTERRPLRGRNGKEQVLRHRQLEEVRIGLVDHSEPEAPSIGGVSGVEPLTADLDDALIGSEIAARDPEQCRLPGPVLTDDGVDLACSALHAYPLQRLHSAERLETCCNERTAFPGPGFVDTS